MSVSKAFAMFMREAPAVAGAWRGVAEALDGSGALDGKTAELAYIAVLAATGNSAGIPFHVLSAKAQGHRARKCSARCSWACPPPARS